MSLGVNKTYGFLLGVVECIGDGVNNLAFDLVGPSTVVSQTASGHADVDLGHRHGLAIVQGFDGSELFQVLLDEVCELAEVFSSLFRRHRLPFALERFPGGGNGDVDILLGRLVNGDDRLLVRRVDGLEGLAVYSLDELIVDEPVKSRRLWSAYVQLCLGCSGDDVRNRESLARCRLRGTDKRAAAVMIERR